ncbi:MAG: glycosyltransferase [SAR324 cluster bacterium]|nr:glycosyltransferase [SAR324 cluster bacterium]
MSRLLTLYSKIKRVPNKAKMLALRANISKETKQNSQFFIGQLNGNCFSETVAQDDLSEYLKPLREGCLAHFKDLHKPKKIKILFHLPSIYALGTRSIFLNWISSLNYMGVEAETLEFTENLREKLEAFKPEILVSVDHQMFLSQLDFVAIADYRKSTALMVALQAHDDSETNDNFSNDKRVALAKKNKVDFFFSFRIESYIEQLFGHLKEAGFTVLSIPFAANPIKDYYIPNEKVFDWSFLGSSNPDKTPRYSSYFKGLFKGYDGVLAGPGWGSEIPLSLEGKYHSLFYSKAKIALNLHLQEQVDRPSEINERVYSLAASGNFQILDQPKALGLLFANPSNVVSLDQPSDYFAAFEHYLNSPDERKVMVCHGFDAIYQGGHTLFHRMQVLIEQIEKSRGQK